MLKFLFRALLVAALLVIAVWAFRSFTGGADSHRSEAREAVQVKLTTPAPPPAVPAPAAPTAEAGAASGLPSAPIPYDQLKNGQATQAPPPADAPQDKNTIFY